MFSRLPQRRQSKLTCAGELRVHVFVDGRHPAEYQRPGLLEARAIFMEHVLMFELIDPVTQNRDFTVLLSQVL